PRLRRREQYRRLQGITITRAHTIPVILQILALASCAPGTGFAETAGSTRKHEWTRIPVIVVAAMMLLVGCAGAGRSVDREGHMTKAEARTDVHKRVDALAKQVGTNPEKTIDGPVSMDPKAPVKSYSYSVDVDVDDDAWERVRGPIAEDLRQQGYAIREDT